MKKSYQEPQTPPQPPSMQMYASQTGAPLIGQAYQPAGDRIDAIWRSLNRAFAPALLGLGL
jgi:hypothetical protein